jgi:hypothetical protein
MMRYNGMKKQEYFFLVDEPIAEFFINRTEGLWYMSINTGELRAYVFMASQIILHLDYNSVNKFSRDLLKRKKHGKA